MRKILIDSDNILINYVEVAEGSDWTPPPGCTLLDDAPGSLGDVWDGTQFAPPPGPTAEEIAAAEAAAEAEAEAERQAEADALRALSDPVVQHVDDILAVRGLKRMDDTERATLSDRLVRLSSRGRLP